MVLLEKEVNGKTFKTEFEFDDEHIKLVKEVLKCLEGKTIDVPDPDKKWEPPWEIPKPPAAQERIYNRLQSCAIPKGYQWRNLTPSELGLVRIPILDWLPVVCHQVAFDNTYGHYRHFENPISHAFEVIQPLHEVASLIMGGFLESEDDVLSDIVTKTQRNEGIAGEIVIARELKKSNLAFRFIFAHEIQHAINKLEVAYPTLTNLKGFIINVLDINNSLLDDFSNYKIMDDSLDMDTSKVELETLESTFGSSIHTWHKGYKQFVDSD